jgi:hypothetical protein
VIQLYVGARSSLVHRPPKELKAFAKVALEPGETETVRLELGDRSFAYWQSGDPDADALAERLATQVAFVRAPSSVGRTRGWSIDAGTYDIHIGRSITAIDHVVSIDVADGTVLGP